MLPYAVVPMAAGGGGGGRAQGKCEFVRTWCTSPAPIREDILYLCMYVFGKKSSFFFFFFFFKFEFYYYYY